MLTQSRKPGNVSPDERASSFALPARTPEKRRAAYHLRYEVYVAEQGKPYPDADHDLRLLTDDLDETAEIILAEVGSQAVGTLRANWFDSPITQLQYPDVLAVSGDLCPAQVVVCSRLAVLPSYRRSRARELLFETIYEIALEKGTKLCFATCAPALLRLFSRYGFREYACPSDDRIVGLLCRVLLVLDDLAYLTRIQSPFLAIAERRSVRSENRPWVSELFAARMAELRSPA